MKVINYEFIDWLKNALKIKKDFMYSFAKDEYYTTASTFKGEISALEEILKEIEHYTEELPNDEKNNEYIYLNNNNWMQFWDKKIQVSQTEDFSKNCTGRFVGYSPESKHSYRISNARWFRYARIEKEK